MLTGSVTDFELPSPLKCQGTFAIVAYISPFTRYICYLPASFWNLNLQIQKGIFFCFIHYENLRESALGHVIISSVGH